MSESPPIINTVAVAGAGLMGAGIAYLSALAGYKTILYDVNQQALISGMLRVTDYSNTAVKLKKIEATKAIELQNSIQTTTNPNLLIADLIIEAVLEQLPIKINLFNQLAQINAPHTILASNTSSIPITQIAAQIPNPHRVVGMHFFNPAPV
ncbi:MAG TPA: 3-hydroxyacyl-CoA dehydrogenase NAD-binding domain-containing protein, partial [Chitinophagales bacterium]|nr:3-hydroxyacyl-CoA dehydrogenase NAD-binding domain-containing protein [Chitinophagales bacterium]